MALAFRQKPFFGLPIPGMALSDGDFSGEDRAVHGPGMCWCESVRRACACARGPGSRALHAGSVALLQATIG